MRRFLVFMAIAALAALSAAGMASAGSNLANGTVLTWTGTNVVWGGIVTCGHSLVRGTITNTAVGISQTLSSASFSSCTTGVTATASSTRHWNLTTTSKDAAGEVFGGQVSNVLVHIGPIFGVTCTYSGTLSGGNYDNTTEKRTVVGSLSSSNGIPCPNSMTTSGIYHVSPTLHLT